MFSFISIFPIGTVNIGSSTPGSRPTHIRSAFIRLSGERKGCYH
jgi:hypothetical protein